jgi:hypothetical protein
MLSCLKKNVCYKTTGYIYNPNISVLKLKYKSNAYISNYLHS